MRKIPGTMRFAPGAMLGATLVMLSGIDAHALGGAVKNRAGYTVPGAAVFLASDTNNRQTTDAKGAFTLTPSSVFGNEHAGGSVVDRFFVRGDRLGFTLSSPARAASLEIFSVDGGRVFAKKLGSLDAGAHEAPLPGLTPGVYSFRLTLDGQAAAARFIHAGGAEGRAPSRVASAASAAAIDTLVIRKSGYLTEKTPVTSYAQADLAIELRPDTAAALPAVSDYAVNGPFATVVQANVGPGNNYTIIRPETLGANGFLHAPIIYGHGINGPVSGFTNFLRAVASHGFVVIARNVLTGGPNDQGNVAAMNDGLNWILRQDTTAGTLYYGKLATDRAASMGFSVGGTAAVNIGAHPALKTVVSIHGHTSTATLHGTLLQTTGTLDNIGLPLQQATFNNSVVPTFLATVTGANHGYIESNNGGVQRPAIIAWLRLRLFNDPGARVFFYGDDCTLCKAPWENPQRKNWE